MKYFVCTVLVSVLFLMMSCSEPPKEQRIMMFGDTSRNGIPFSKDPHVVSFKGEYLMYYSTPPYSDKNHPVQGWGIGVARSRNLIDWEKAGEVGPAADYESKGLCAPAALVRNDTVHLFYQTYGNWKDDAICHAWSVDGIHFTRNVTNPIFRPSGAWTAGRAIDAEVVKFRDTYFLYYATRDTAMKIQMVGVASAPAGTSFKRDDWTQLTDHPILEPRYPWEGKCIEGSSVIQVGDSLFMFYAGAYNNDPQQVGVAKSHDGVRWERLSNKPFLPNGDPGEWNSSESGHPHIFKDNDGRTYLFFQGNNDRGKTWFISNTEVKWNQDGPYLPR